MLEFLAKGEVRDALDQAGQRRQFVIHSSPPPDREPPTPTLRQTHVVRRDGVLRRAAFLETPLQPPAVPRAVLLLERLVKSKGNIGRRQEGHVSVRRALWWPWHDQSV